MLYAYNNTSEIITITDIGEKLVINPKTKLKLPFQAWQLKQSDTLFDNVAGSNLILYQDEVELDLREAVEFLSDVVNKQQTNKYSNRPLVYSTTRPDTHFVHFTAYGDNNETGEIGGGDEFMFEFTDGGVIEQVRYIQWNDDAYIKDGIIIYENMPWNTELDLEIVAPAGIPFPAYAGNGNFDKDENGNFIPNGTYTGQWYIFPHEVAFVKYANIHISGTNNTGLYLISEDNAFISKYYKTKIRVKVPNPANCRLLGMFLIHKEKSKTLNLAYPEGYPNQI